jgi:transcriptional regulator with XRE-family HTH domain
MARFHHSKARVRLAHNLKFLRAQLGMTQSAIAKRSGVNQKTISNMEDPTGDVDPLLGNVEKLADCYGLSVSGLLAEDFGDSAAVPDARSGWIESLSGLTATQKQLLISLAEEFAAGNSNESKNI